MRRSVKPLCYLSSYSAVMLYVKGAAVNVIDDLKVHALLVVLCHILSFSGGDLHICSHALAGKSL